MFLQICRHYTSTIYFHEKVNNLDTLNLTICRNENSATSIKYSKLLKCNFKLIGYFLGLRLIIRLIHEVKPVDNVNYMKAIRIKGG